MADKPKTVLLVDDVQLFLRLEETFFRRAGCKVLTAASGKDALRIAKEKSPDIILVDYYMQDMTGGEVCKEIKTDAKTKDIPVIVVSTSSKKEDIDACFKAGCDDYLTKPVQPDVVLSRAAQLLAIPHREHRRLPVNFRIEGEAPPLTFTGFSKNLSQSGISIEAEQAIESGMRLKLWMPINEDRTLVEFMGEVVRSEVDKQRGKYTYGIRFTEISESAKSALEEFLKKHLPEPQMVY